MELENRQEALDKVRQSLTFPTQRTEANTTSHAQGLAAAIDRSQILAGRIEAHEEQLGNFGEKTATILGTLDEASLIASNIRGSVGNMESIYTWPPYIVGMIYPLVLGYFPVLLSWIWNLGLIILGKFAQGKGPSLSLSLPV